MALKIFFLLSLLTAYVVSDTCVTYDFEENFDNLFSSHGTCSNIPSSLWTIKEYSDFRLASPNDHSTKFITPSVHGQVNCISSFHLTMHSGGVFEFNVYVEPAEIGDHIQIMAFSDEPDSFSTITGLSFINYFTGWHTASFSVVGAASYRGYIALFSMASPNATILVDSFHYTPPGVDGSSCQIYSSKMVLKTFILFSFFVSCVISDSCVTYNFEEGFNDLFGYYGSCNSFPLWRLSDYKSLPLNTPNEHSTKFITPETSWISCASSFNFTMNAGGSIEFNIYMEQTDSLDQVYLMAYHIGPDGIDFVIGMEVVRHQTGWDTVKMPLGGPRTFTGYVSIFGYSARNSKVLIDSFRYIPPGVDASSCQIYG
ncbi:uncharacterized protein LOC111355283 [Spodoptera litura]|uniref:Uncharacterized protein LOC111355283 n=1 Tax=Spodoptera litura TaxID=69820 RepID=A0A9J7IT30_SPOLT|nr:uncharacterized protein LOC111355283 [Spodoptera litura]